MAVFVKICGITSEEDALLAVAMGADAIGFLLAPSKRQITATRARDIAARLPPEVLTVGVFRNELKERVVEFTHAAGLKAVQLHGNETAAESSWVSERVPMVIKAFVAGDPDIDRQADYGAEVVHVEGKEPGSGVVFDWKLLDTKSRAKILLAGGLGPDNVASAIEQVRPWGVDVSTGVESSPGVKDPAKVRRFIAAARDAAAAIEPIEDHVGVGAVEDDPIYDWHDEP